MAKRRGNNEGSIYQRENGRWVAQVRVRGKRFAKSFSTQKDCQYWIREIRENIDNGLSQKGMKITMGEYLDLWLQSIQGNVRPNTFLQYAGIVRNYLMPSLKKIILRDLQPIMVQDLYGSILNEGKSRRTVQLVHSVLHRALSTAAKQGMVSRNVASLVDPPKPEHKEMKVFDENQARAFLMAAKGERYETLFHLAIATGLRQGELLGLKWNDVDWATNDLLVQRQLHRISGEGLVFSEPKTKASKRSIVLGSESLAQLMRHRDRQELEKIQDEWRENNLIFPSMIGTPTDQRRLHGYFKKILKKARLPDIRFHDLRHTAATLMLNHGTPLMVVSKRLGHSKPSVTLDVYGHHLPGMQKEAAELVDGLITPVETKWQQIGNRLDEKIDSNVFKREK